MAKRFRKSQGMIDVFYELYCQFRGKKIGKDMRSKIAEQLNLTPQQVYKFYWDLKNKVEKDKKI